MKFIVALFLVFSVSSNAFALCVMIESPLFIKISESKESQFAEVPAAEVVGRITVTYENYDRVMAGEATPGVIVVQENGEYEFMSFKFVSAEGVERNVFKDPAFFGLPNNNSDYLGVYQGKWVCDQ